MKTILARTLLNYSVEELWSILTGNFTLRFDNGEELDTNYRETLYSTYAWEFHRRYPLTPLLKEHHLAGVLRGDRLGSDTHLQLLGNVMWAVYDHYTNGNFPLHTSPIIHRRASGVGITQPGLAQVSEIEFRDHLAELVYRTSNQMYNDLSYRLSEYVVSLDITDFIEVLKHPRVREVNDSIYERHNNAKTAPAKQMTLEDTYNVIKDVLQSGKDLPSNPISLAARSKLVNMNQVLQCVGPRGYLTDTDSHLFRYPVLRGYAQGLRLFHDSLIESRSAGKALLFSKTPLQQAEYFSRRLQLMSEVVQHLHPGDCGTTQYLHWKVRPQIIENGQLVHPGDLKQLVGKKYMSEEGVLKTIRASDRHLVGKTLKIRSVTHCAHPDPYGVCATCFGELSLSVPAGTNLGQMCCTSLAQKSSQNVLSVKHLDGSSMVESAQVAIENRQYLRVGADDNSYMLAEDLKGKNVKLVVSAERASNLTDVMEVADVASLNPTRVSELAEITILIEDGVEPVMIGIDVTQGRRLASMTMPLLKYIRANGWSWDERGNYTIDMEKWDWSEPILSLPLRHFNMSDHSQNIASMLESSVDRMQERDTNVSPDAVLVELFDLVNQKLNVNLAVLDVVLYSTMIVSAENGNYELPKPWTTRSLGVYKLTMAYRSLAAAMAYENHREVIVSPLSYIYTNRPSHPMDGLVMPAEVFRDNPEVNYSGLAAPEVRV